MECRQKYKIEGIIITPLTEEQRIYNQLDGILFDLKYFEISNDEAIRQIKKVFNYESNKS